LHELQFFERAALPQTFRQPEERPDILRVLAPEIQTMSRR
jgi:hypothetical protein